MTLDLSEVNKDVIGVYTATINYEDESKTFRIKVTDTEEPEITLERSVSYSIRSSRVIKYWAYFYISLYPQWNNQSKIKGAVSTDDLREIGCQVELSNTYHLHVRTGDKLIKEMGGIRE